MQVEIDRVSGALDSETQKYTPIGNNTKKVDASVTGRQQHNTSVLGAICY